MLIFIWLALHDFIWNLFFPFHDSSELTGSLYSWSTIYLLTFLFVYYFVIELHLLWTTFFFLCFLPFHAVFFFFLLSLSFPFFSINFPKAVSNIHSTSFSRSSVFFFFSFYFLFLLITTRCFICSIFPFFLHHYNWNYILFFIASSSCWSYIFAAFSL